MVHMNMTAIQLRYNERKKKIWEKLMAEMEKVASASLVRELSLP